MYCRKCGAEIFDEAVVCPHCGVATGNTMPSQNDSGSLWWFVLGFIIPLIGLILYIVWKDEKPKNAKMVGWGALISVILAIILPMVFFGVLVVTN